MIYLTKPISIMNGTMTVTVEDKMTDMTSEHVDTLQRELDRWKRAFDTITSEAKILAHILSEIVEAKEIEASDIEAIMNEMQHDRTSIVDILDAYNVFAEHYFRREYEVTITVPVQVTLSVEAQSVDEAEDAAMSSLDCNGLDCYNIDYDLWFNASVDDIREV